MARSRASRWAAIDPVVELRRNGFFFFFRRGGAPSPAFDTSTTSTLCCPAIHFSKNSIVENARDDAVLPPLRRAPSGERHSSSVEDLKLNK